MELGLTQEIDRLNNEVDTLRSQVTFWEEKSDHRKERIKELKQFHEWNKSAALKLNDEKQNNEKLKKENAELKAGLVSGDLNLCSGEGIEMFHKLKADIEKLKSKDKIASGVIGRLNERERELKKENEKLKEEVEREEERHQGAAMERDEALDNIDDLKKENEEIKKEIKEVNIRNYYRNPS